MEEYRFLSNFYETPVLYGGLTYGSNEAAFQAQKCMTEKAKLQFTEYSPKKSKGIGRKVQLRSDWEEVKVGLMEEIVRAKFAQHPELAELLVGTGDKILGVRGTMILTAGEQVEKYGWKKRIESRKGASFSRHGV